MARVPYASGDELAPEHRDLVVSSLQPGRSLNVYAAAANNPAVLAGLRSFLGALWSDSGLGDRERELVILAVAAETESEYEWQQHARIAEGVGVSAAEMAAVAAGESDPFEPATVALLDYARAVVNEAVTDEHHDAVAEHFAEDAVVGAAALAACYLQVARLIDALGVEIETGDEFVGWDVAGLE